MRFSGILAGLTSWFGRRRPLAAAAPGRYVDHLGQTLPSAAGAWRRVEEEQITPRLRETRYYRQGVEWLARRVQQGLDVAGQPYLLRITYWPWGQESIRLEKYVRDGQACVEYQRFFGDGELLEHKLLVGRELRTHYTFRWPAGQYTYVEAMPVYPGGQERLLQDVTRFTKYPAVSLRNREEGRVVMYFVVGATGLITTIRVKEGVTPALDAAATQVLREMSSIRWRPGFQNHRAVTVFYTMPITFFIK
ncbi:energy transducer TonB [Hymenobacter metallilatus]|uniref:Energy transducer TonB n=1 Tax=Hymenobacter metallilatus TaxID=2493666 RepID=A0A428JK53_9BACT|nr:energy transducer TonB [Hymenobacter metallilatus]RSK33135.1 energy transducer TonB [Hymenobacter metallilatus]